MSKLSKIDRIDEFETLRGLMALWVLLGHVALTFDLPAFKGMWWWIVLESNLKAVDVFIILSGFVIFHLLRAKPETYGSYLYRRFLRLFPAYLVWLLISVAMLQPSMQALRALGESSDHNQVRLQIFNNSLSYFWPQLVAHLTMLHGLVPTKFLPSSDYAFMGQAWSISVEWQFYLVAPFAFALARSRHWWNLALLSAVIGVLIVIKRFWGGGFIGAHAEYFAIGCASSFLWRTKSEWVVRFGKHSNLLIPLITLLLVFVLRDNWQLALWFFVLASCVATRKGGAKQIIPHAVSSLLTIPPLRWLGRISYSFYLIHMAALYAMLWMLRASHLSQVNLMLLTLTGTLIVTLLAAHFSYQWIELPFIQLGLKSASRKPSSTNELTASFRERA